MKNLFLFLATLLVSFNLNAQTKQTTTIDNAPAEYWWSVNADGEFFATPEIATMLVSSTGRYIWSETPMSVTIDRNTITIISDTPNIEPVKAGRTLREAYLVCFHKHVKSAQTHSITGDRQHEIEAAVHINDGVKEYLAELSATFASTGEPTIRPIEYVFPYEGFADCTTQYVIGTRYLVVPLTDKKDSVTVRFPKGQWTDENGNKITGPRVINIPTTDNVVLLYELNK